jgi:hypothetical protein
MSSCRRDPAESEVLRNEISTRDQCQRNDTEGSVFQCRRVCQRLQVHLYSMFGTNVNAVSAKVVKVLPTRSSSCHRTWRPRHNLSVRF